MIKVGRGAFAPPFMVMDMISAANALADSLPPGAPRVLRMEVGQPGTGAPHGARLAAARALGGADPMGYTEALGRPRSEPGSGSTMLTGMASSCRRNASP